MCSSNSLWGENTWLWIIVAIIVIWIFCGCSNNCGCDNNGCGCNNNCGCCC